MYISMTAGIGNHPCFNTFYYYDPLEFLFFSLYIR